MMSSAHLAPCSMAATSSFTATEVLLLGIVTNTKQPSPSSSLRIVMFGVRPCCSLQSLQQQCSAVSVQQPQRVQRYFAATQEAVRAGAMSCKTADTPCCLSGILLLGIRNIAPHTGSTRCSGKCCRQASLRAQHTSSKVPKVQQF